MKALDHVVVVVAAVAQRLGAERGLGVGERDRDRRRRLGGAARCCGERHRHLEAGERVAAVAVGAAGQVVDGVVVDRGALGVEAARDEARERRRRRAARGGTASSGESSGGFTSKYGFSVVAPISIEQARLDRGQQRVLLRLVEPVDLVEEQDRALAVLAEAAARPGRSPPARPSPPAVTADSCSNALAVWPAISRASVVLPVPGGPQRITDDSRSASISARSGRPGPSRCSWPTMSSSVRGRSRAASGARRASRSSAAAANRSSATASRPPPVVRRRSGYLGWRSLRSP